MTDELGPEYGLMQCVFGPEDLGYPCRRRRRYSFFWRKSRFTFHGCAEEFLEVFRASTELNGDVYFIAPPSVRRQAALKRAAKNGNHFTAENAEFVKARDQVSADGQRRLKAHMELMTKRCGLDGCYVFDNEHWPDFCTGGWQMPPLVTHGLIVSASRDETLLPIEHLAVQGEPALAGLSNKFPCCFMPLATKWSSPETENKGALRMMAGNAMHTGALTAWMLYGLSNLEPVRSTFVM